ncbi:MAG: MBL fold metallo-hydrolase [Clostridiales bacterium]|nr:MBL fold metallo-hydrolase [Clostridiales bacterium]
MKITFIGATHEVTGSCTLLEVNGKRILVDCGMEQGVDLFENIEIPVAPGEIDAVIVTHAHIDHSGKLPFLVAHGYSGPIYATVATKKLCDIMLMDSAHIQEFESQWRNRKNKRAGKEEYETLYTTQDAQNTLKLFSTSGYDTDVEVCDGVTLRFIDAGHLLGSSNVFLTLREGDVEKTILFSGDLGNPDKPLIRSPQTPPHTDYAVCESTYGDRLHTPQPDYVHNIAAVIQRTLDRGGNVVIPAFAVGRTQELLYFIRIIKEKGLVKNHADFPVVIDSPLAVEATNIYSTDMSDYYDEEANELLQSGINPVTFPGLKVSVSSDESKAINDDPTPKVIISASGMCEAGRIRHHLKHNLWRPECSVLFVGYQSRETVGAKLLDGADAVKLFGEEIQVQAEIVRLDSFSSHADKNMLLKWLEEAAPSQMVFINHGEDKVTESFAELAAERTGVKAVAPYSGEVWDLAACELVQRAEIVPVIRKESRGGLEIRSFDSNGKLSSRRSDDRHDDQYKVTESTGRAVTAYEELITAGNRLMEVIEHSRGRANKELRKFANEINKLISKFGQ